MQRASHLPFTLSQVSRAVAGLLPYALLGLACGISTRAQAQQNPAPPLVLKSTPMLAEKLPDGPDNQPPTFVFGDRVSGRPNLETVIDGVTRQPWTCRSDMDMW